MENQSGERRVCKSDKDGKPNPDFEELFRLANELAIAKNPQRWFNLSAVREDESGAEQPVMDASEVERLEVVEEIERRLEEAMVEKGESFSAFVKFIEELDWKGLRRLRISWKMSWIWRGLTRRKQRSTSNLYNLTLGWFCGIFWAIFEAE